MESFSSLSKNKFIKISVFISVFEYFKDCVNEKALDFEPLDKIKNNKKKFKSPDLIAAIDFLPEGSDLREEKEDFLRMVSEKYKEIYRGDDFLKYLFCLKEVDIIEQSDIDLILELRKYRNELVHNMIIYLMSEEKGFDQEKLNDLLRVFSKVERNWLKYSEGPALSIFYDLPPDFFENDSAVPGSVLVITRLLMLSGVLKGDSNVPS